MHYPLTIRASRSQLIWSPVLGWALLSCAVSAAGPTHRQTPLGSYGAPGRPRRAAYLPPNPVAPGPAGGIPTVGAGGWASLGAYALSLIGSIPATHNVFAQNATTAPTGQPRRSTTVAPALDLRSEWLNHAIHFLAGGTLGYYASAPTQNFKNFTLAVDGKLDIYTDVYITGALAYKQNTEALGTPNVSFAQAPTVVDSVPVEVSYYQRFNRVFYQVTGRATRFWYHDFSTITSSGLPGSSRDRTEYEQSLKIGYEVYDDLAFYVTPAMNQRRYAQQINIVGQSRDSNGQTIGLGFTWSPNATSILDGFIGYQTQNDYTSGLPPTSAYTFGLIGSWNGYQPLTLRPLINRSIQETALSNYLNYVSTVVGVDFIYDIHDAWKATGGLSYTNADYTPYPGLAPPRTDTFITAKLGLLYTLRPQIEIGPLIEYSQGSSTDPVAGPSFTRQIFSIRLIARR